MEQFSLPGNRIIETHPDQWQLITPELDETVLVEAVSGQPLRYMASFGLENNLPAGGQLPLEQIKEVALGWSLDDQSWHLGLLFEATFASQRGGRWCELATWRDPETTVYSDRAAQAGEALAHIIARPFHVVGPGANGASREATVSHTSDTEDATAFSPAPLLKELPIHLGAWQLEDAAPENNRRQLQFVRPARWRLNRLLRAAWYSIWAAIYIALALITLGTSIAPARPVFLPYLALATAAILIGLAVYILHELFTTPHRIIIDSTAQAIRAVRGNGEQWRVAGEDIDSLYITHTVNKKHIIQSGELNLLLQDGDFKLVLEQNRVKGKPADSNLSEEERKHTRPVENLTELTRRVAYSDLQAAGVYVAEALDLPCWYDRQVS